MIRPETFSQNDATVADVDHLSRHSHGLRYHSSDMCFFGRELLLPENETTFIRSRDLKYT
jgi:hypothetical protein